MIEIGRDLRVVPHGHPTEERSAAPLSFAHFGWVEGPHHSIPIHGQDQSLTALDLNGTRDHHLTGCAPGPTSRRKLQVSPRTQFLREQGVMDKLMQRRHDSNLGAKTDQGSGQGVQLRRTPGLDVTLQ